MSFSTLSNRPDFELLARLQRVERGVLFVAAALGLAVLALWLIPALRSLAPDGWWLMKFNTALSLLLAVASYALQRPRATPNQIRLGRLAAVAILGLTVATLAEWNVDLGLGVDRWLVDDPWGGAYPGRMSLQTSLGYLFAGVGLLCLRQDKGHCGMVADAAAILLAGLVMMVLAGYLFDATHLFGTDELTRTSPHTLFGFACLALVAGIRRARQGYSDVLVGIGIGSHIARTIMPLALATPFALALLHRLAVDHGWLDASYAAALRAATLALLVLIVVLWMAQRINTLEAELRMISLTDELTGVNNRRGFTFLAEQAVRAAQREELPAVLFFFDIDGLKQVNDELGHEAGSQLISTVAGLLVDNFRGSDVIGRVGGDEFCVLAARHQPAPEATLHRLEEAVAAFNRRRALPFEVHFSAGHSALDLTRPDPLTAAMHDADLKMYRAKQRRKRRRVATAAPLPTASAEG